MKKNLTTPAGQANSQQASVDERANAINQTFAIFRRNYHNQYYKAFPGENDASIAKRLWLDALARFNSDTILKATKEIIENNEFLPTLAAMIKACENQNNPNLPGPHAAYIEACQASSPKTNYAWSHPAVYHAGKQSDWYFLQNNNETVAYPIFKQHYQEICDNILKGISYDMPQTLALPEESTTPLNKESNLEKLQSLKDQLKL